MQYRTWDEASEGFPDDSTLAYPACGGIMSTARFQPERTFRGLLITPF